MGLERQRMKNITIALPDIFEDNIEKLQVAGVIPSRSEGIRTAVREFLKGEGHFLRLLEYTPNKGENL